MDRRDEERWVWRLEREEVISSSMNKKEKDKNGK